MFRQLGAILVLVAFSVQLFNRAVIIVDYYTNTASFAKNCENKARPVMHCNGKCQMMKKLKEEEKKEQQNPAPKTGNKTEVISSRSFFASVSVRENNSQHSYSPHITGPVASGISRDIFHPPGLV